MNEKILVIDDMENILTIFSIVLGGEGYKVITGKNGAELDKLYEKEKPDLVFLDVLLPDMDNQDIINRVKKISKQVPVVMISGYDNTEFAVKTLKAGAYNYVLKPFENEEVLKITRKVLAQEKREEKQKKTPAKVPGYIIISGVILFILIIGVILLLLKG